jgi:predicted RNA-binding protein YlxR (DUF448 family)
MKPKKVPIRRCIACREGKPKRELLRIVKSPENDILIDKTGRMNGRGAYICNNMDCFLKARKTKALNREFKMEIPDCIYDTLESQLEGKSDG